MKPATNNTQSDTTFYHKQQVTIKSNIELVELKLNKLHDKFQKVCFKIEALEIKRDALIEANKSSYRVEDAIYELEIEQSEINEDIEEQEKKLNQLSKKLLKVS